MHKINFFKVDIIKRNAHIVLSCIVQIRIHYAKGSEIDTWFEVTSH